MRPCESPCLFPNIPSSCLSPLPLKARKTTLASASKRNVLPDELERFYEQDLLVFGIIPEKLAEELDLVVYRDETDTVIQSKNFKCGVPLFVIIYNIFEKCSS